MTTVDIRPVESMVEDALVASALAHRCPVWVAESDMTKWASATFTGTRIMMTVMGNPSADLNAWIEMLPEAEWAIKGHLVAEVTVERVTRGEGATSIYLEILTVQER